MIKKFILTTIMLLSLIFVTNRPAIANDILILCYHDIGQSKDIYSVTPANFKSHLDYLKENGFTPISFDEYLSANKNGTKLPSKPVLLTFDDGYESFYTKVFPLLKEYNYPAMLAVVTSWLTYAPADVGPLVTWQQIREMEESGLVTIASHSHMSHRFGVINPQGDRAALFSHLQYKDGRYERSEDYQQRLQSDLRMSQAVFEKKLGHKVQAMVWPYGEYTPTAIEIAKHAGFEACFGLGGKVNQQGVQALHQAERIVLMNNPPKDKFAQMIKSSTLKPIKAAQLDLDMIYDPKDPKQTEENLNMAIERILESDVNTVYLQAFSDLDGSGNIKSVYFHTNAAPVQSDLFSHAVTRIHQAGKIKVYAWMPTLAAQWLLDTRPEDTVQACSEENLGWYRRATPFSPVVENRLIDLFSDLAKYSNIDGILFQDDLYLNDFEDFSPPAKAVFKQKFGFNLTPDILQDDSIMSRWTKLKVDTMTNLTLKLSQAVRQHRSNVAIARNIYPVLITQPEAEKWFAQNYNQYLETYDYTVIMAYPYLEKQYNDPIKWLENLAVLALQDKKNAHKVVFKLQTYDWNQKKWISARELARQTECLIKQGAINLAYYPENVFSK